MRRKVAAAGLLALIVTACGPTYPLGMSEAEWLALPPDRQYEARLRQADLDATARAADAAREAEERRLEAERQARIDGLYAHGGFGSVVECAMQGGLADFHPGWKPYEPLVFAIARGDERPVTLRRADGRRTQDLWVALDEHGTHLRLCHQPPSRWSADCATVAATSRQFAQGVALTVSAEDALKGAELSCAHAIGRRRY